MERFVKGWGWNMVRTGITERVATMISDHKTRSVFEQYNIVSDSDLRMAAKRHNRSSERFPGLLDLAWVVKAVTKV
ncbi:MAG: hypothetical protein JRJ82_03620 [Deltaproteobacteria bacterium]|nr:hypothetical protein [Deltaproteobacteria bacterium]MBW1816788.1 hypothetical protein [Deltaproteobacteria bacterium]